MRGRAREVKIGFPDLTGEIARLKAPYHVLVMALVVSSNYVLPEVTVAL